MANRWNRNGSYGAPGFIGSGAGVGFYMGTPPSADRRPYGTPAQKPFFGSYREDNFGRRSDRDDFRGSKRGPPRSRSPGDRRHEGSGQRRDRPFNKRQSYPGKYEVRVPKTVFNLKTRSFTELRHSYPRLNVASDFYECNSLWCDAFPMHSPFKLGSGTDYNVFNREVEPPVPADTSLLNPPDADYSYSARVMLMACPTLAELYKNTCRVAAEPHSSDKTPPTKNIHFLVGGRTKSETMALGGPWSPSLDGTDPSGDPKTLINTAIRTFKGYTGVDLSSCNEWVRFMELRYYRFADTKAPSFVGDDEERTVDTERPEVVVFFIPNVSHLVPSEEEWAKTKDYYNSILQNLLSPEKKAEEETPMDTKESETPTVDTSVDESTEAEPQTDVEATHYSKLDINALKVNELRNELSARKLDTKGLKVNLVSRLQAALDEERKAESTDGKTTEVKAEEKPAKPASPTTPANEESKDLTEKDRRRLERFYRLNEKPSIVIHPNKHARGGRFDCHRVSLFSLLDYRTEDQKEINFEVSLFAEQFHEMLQRDCAFAIFKAINDAPEKDPKSDQDGKLENGVTDDDEPDNKRRRTDDQEESDETKARLMRRTVLPDLLFAFTYFDWGRAGYIREHDLCEILHLLGLRYSKAQMRKLVTKVANRREHVTYHHITDSDIVEGDDRDVVTLRPAKEEDIEVTKMLALGNRALFDMEQPAMASKITIGGGNLSEINTRMEKAEEMKRRMEFQFFQIKDELEKTRIQYNTLKDTTAKLRTVNTELSDRLKTEQKQSHEHRSLYNTYHHLVRSARDQMERVVFDINKQFDKEKAKREAEKAAEKAKADEEAQKEKEDAKVDEPNDETEKTEDKEWQVVDAV